MYFVNVQERNSKLADGGGDSSRITSGARRNLGRLGTAIDVLSELLESAECAKLYVNFLDQLSELSFTISSIYLAQFDANPFFQAKTDCRSLTKKEYLACLFGNRVESDCIQAWSCKHAQHSQAHIINI